MSTSAKIVFSAAMASLLAGCATLPDGPSVLALPGNGKNFEQFRADDAVCRQYATAQIGGKSANQVGADSFAKSAALTTAVGATVGALADGGRGAGTGAAAGLALGSAIGSSESQASSYGAQRRYNYAYVQCMYAKGNLVPVSGTMQSSNSTGYRETTVYPPPPPPGYNRPY